MSGIIYYLSPWVLTGTLVLRLSLPFQVNECGNHSPRRGSDLSKSSGSRWTSSGNPDPLASPGPLYRPVLTEAAPLISPRARSPPRIPPPAPARALTLRLGVVLRFGQEQPAQRGQEQQGPHGQGVGTPGQPGVARRLESSRRGRRSGCHALGPPRGRCRTAPLPLPAARPGGKGFPADLPKPRLLRVGAAPSGLSPRLPGFSAGPPSSLFLPKGASPRPGRGERGNNV